MKNNLKIAVIILVTFFTSCISKEAYKDKIIETMVSGCFENTQHQEVCNCFGNKIRNKYNYEELKKINDGDTGSLEQSF